jgi:16S rRNA (adenine1518-N6/adenine1519-N6)-dimethyltransferase
VDVRTLLRRYNLDPYKGLGQNFLVDQNALKEIVECAEVSREDTVLEIGAGLGNLTRLLAQAARRVVAVEIDRKLIPPLQEVMARHANCEIIEGDILELNPAVIIGENGYLVVANIPYYITSAIIRHLLTNASKPKRLVLTMQSEVARRICAEPGDLSLLALSVQVFGVPRIMAAIPAASFFPPPKVDSSTLRVDIYPEPLMSDRQLVLFFRLAKAGFSQKRKMLRNTMAAGLHLTSDQAEALLRSAGIDPMRRAQTLDLVEWRTLVGEYENLQSAVNVTDSTSE